MNKLKIGFALCGSYCTFEKTIPVIEKLCQQGHEIIPIMSANAYSTDTRFGKADVHINNIEKICGKHPLTTAVEVEPIGPQSLLDILVIAPCTGNSLAKIACGISDTSVTGAAKSQLRGGKPLLIAVSTNDAMGANAKNIGNLINVKNIYFVPMRQDSPFNKPASMVAEMSLIPEAINAAMSGSQIQPVYLSPN